MIAPRANAVTPVSPMNVFLKKIERQLTYKAGWTIELFESNMNSEGFFVKVRTSPQPDASNPTGPRVPIHGQNFYPMSEFRPYDEEYVIAMVRQEIEAMERHESHEWLRYDGVHVTKPH